jgi:DCN1-like protein 4/5
MGNTKSKRQTKKPEFTKDAPKKQVPPQNPNAKPAGMKGTGSKQSPREEAFSVKRLEEVFNKFRDEDDDQIGPDGMEKFCIDLGVDPEDVVTLVIAYHLKAQQMGSFSRDEFMKGFETLELDTLDKMRKHLPKFREELNDSTKFKNIYRFAFDFSKEPQQKCIDIEIAQALIELILVERYPLARSFLEFLNQQSSYKGLNVDQWTSLLEFCKTIDTNFSNYDENGAWPCVLDEWAAWVKAKKEEGA